jgi:D-psicose/D-tagatose/L-ribulose 3-epimerase
MRFGINTFLFTSPFTNKSTKLFPQFMALLDQMVELDCPTLVGPVYSAVGRADAVPPTEYKKQWKTVVANLKKVCSHAEKLGRTIALEPLNRFETDFINTTDQGLKMISDVGSPALKLHLDTFHMNIEEKDQAAAIRKAGKLLGHFHACGSDRGTPGGDHINWPSIAKALKQIKYDGDVVIESFTTDVKVIARAAAIWRQIEPNRNDIAVKGLQFLKKNLH